jgi:S-adenosylmethionine hydrolase
MPALKDAKVPFYKNMMLITDFNCGVANAQIELRFQNVFLYTTQELAKGKLADIDSRLKPASWIKDHIYRERPFVPTSIHNVPFGNIDFAAYANYTCYRALGSNTRPNIFIHITDPGVGFGKDRSILVTDEHNVFIGPNNGSLGLMAKYFESRSIGYEIHKIDIPFIEHIERMRTGSPTYILPHTFHGRDLFAVVAGLIAGGVHPRSLALDEDEKILEPAYAQNISRLPANIGEKAHFQVFRDNTAGNIKTSFSVDQKSFDRIVAEGAKYHVSKPNGARIQLPFLKRQMTFPAKNVFADMKAGEPLLYLGSTFAINWDERFVELAINMGNAGQSLDVSPLYGAEMFIERIQ